VTTPIERVRHRTWTTWPPLSMCCSADDRHPDFDSDPASTPSWIRGLNR
jgi:hypothetical protein